MKLEFISGRRSFILIAFAGTCSLVALLAHAYAGFSSRFMADTYSFAAWVHRYGLIGAQRRWYMTWSGRFSANLLESIAATIGPRVIPLLPAFALVLWSLALVAALLQLRRPASRPASLLIATALAAVVLHATLDGIPNVGQSLYWSDGLHNYVAPLILATAYAGLIAYARERWRESRAGRLWLLLFFTLSFVAGGFTEMALALQISAVALTLLATILAGSAKLRQHVTTQSASPRDEPGLPQ